MNLLSINAVIYRCQLIIIKYEEIKKKFKLVEEKLVVAILAWAKANR